MRYRSSGSVSFSDLASFSFFLTQLVGHCKFTPYFLRKFQELEQRQSLYLKYLKTREGKMESGSSSLEISDARKESVSIDIKDEDNLVSSIKEKMDNISYSQCVSRVPEKLYKEYQHNFFPSSISIGPFHHGKISGADNLKWRYFNMLLSRRPNTEAVIDNCVGALRRAEQRTRKFYGEPIPLKSDEFVEMMMIDGCFIIEIFLEFHFKSLRQRDNPIFGTKDMVFKVRSDLILLENQIPFFILEKLYNLVPIPKQCHLSLIEIACCFFQKMIPIYISQSPLEISSRAISHLLDLIRHHFLPTHHKHLPNVEQKHIVLPQATHLLKLGIKLKVAPTEESPLNIRFMKGKLEIPPLIVNDYTQVLFRNLIAMELCQKPEESSKHITSYTIIMGKLLKSEKDVKSFQEMRILVDEYDRRGYIVDLFNKLQEVDVDMNIKCFYYSEICERINAYEKGGMHHWWSSLRYSHDRAHVGVAGFSLAMVLLVFLFTGALFTAVSFLLHHFQ